MFRCDRGNMDSTSKSSELDMAFLDIIGRWHLFKNAVHLDESVGLWSFKNLFRQHFKVSDTLLT